MSKPETIQRHASALEESVVADHDGNWEAAARHLAELLIIQIQARPGEVEVKPLGECTPGEQAAAAAMAREGGTVQ